MRIIVVLLLLLSSVAEATHLRSGFITIRRAAPGSLACEITITIYTNTGSEIRFGDGVLSFGDGQEMITPTLEAVQRPDLGPNIGYVVYSVIHQYNEPGIFVVGYLEANRDAGVINIYNSVETRYYTESQVDLRVNDSPALTFVAPAVFRATLGTTFSAGLGVAADEDFRFQYLLTTPKKERAAVVDSYYVPAGVSLNPYNGQFTWEMESGTSLLQGQYTFAMRIGVFDLEGHFVGFVTFDFQVILVDGGGLVGGISFGKDLGDKGRVYTDTQDSVKVVFEADTPDWDMDLYAELPDEAVSMTTKDSTANGKFFKVCWVKFTNMLSILRVNPHVVVVRSRHGESSYDVTSLFFTTDTDFTDAITGIEETPRDLRLFPNPFQRFLNIEGDGLSSGNISIFKLTGEHVLTMKWTTGQSLDLIELPSGFYVTRINGRAFRVVKRYREP